MALWGKTDNEGSKPKFLSNDEKANTFGVDTQEIVAESAQQPNYRASHSGWVKTTPAYVDSGGSFRLKSEVLVAMGSMTGDAEDNVFQDYTIIIDTQPANVTVTSPANLVLSVAASTVPAGGTLTYQWMRRTAPGQNFQEISGATSNTLTIASGDANYVNGYTFRCNISATGALMLPSNSATATIV